MDFQSEVVLVCLVRVPQMFQATREDTEVILASAAYPLEPGLIVDPIRLFANVILAGQPIARRKTECVVVNNERAIVYVVLNRPLYYTHYGFVQSMHTVKFQFAEACIDRPLEGSSPVRS